jgi:hypothetical protein
MNSFLRFAETTRFFGVFVGGGFSGARVRSTFFERGMGIAPERECIVVGAEFGRSVALDAGVAWEEGDERVEILVVDSRFATKVVLDGNRERLNEVDHGFLLDDCSEAGIFLCLRIIWDASSVIGNVDPDQMR